MWCRQGARLRQLGSPRESGAAGGSLLPAPKRRSWPSLLRPWTLLFGSAMSGLVLPAPQLRPPAQGLESTAGEAPRNHPRGPKALLSRCRTPSAGHKSWVAPALAVLRRRGGCRPGNPDRRRASTLRLGAAGTFGGTALRCVALAMSFRRRCGHSGICGDAWFAWRRPRSEAWRPRGTRKIPFGDLEPPTPWVHWALPFGLVQLVERFSWMCPTPEATRRCHGQFQNHGEARGCPR